MLIDVLIPVAEKGGVENVIKIMLQELESAKMYFRVIQLVWEGTFWLPENVDFHPLLEGRKGHTLQEFADIYADFLKNNDKPDIILAVGWPYMCCVGRAVAEYYEMETKIVSWLHNPLERYEVRGYGGIEELKQADYHLAIFLQIQKCLHEAGYETILFPLYPECDSATALNAVYQSDVSGIILVGCSYIALKSNLRAGFPHVWIDCEDAPDKTRGICRVESDHLVSGMLAAQELYRTGSVRPLIITQEKLSYRGMARIEGMRSEYKKHDISISDEQIIRVPVQGDGFTIVRDTVRYLITKGTSFDGIFCISDWRTLGAYTAVKQMGLRVPEDVRIVSFDGIARATHSVVNITAVAQNTELLARDACELLLHLIRKEGIPVRMIVVPTKIIAGATV